MRSLFFRVFRAALAGAAMFSCVSNSFAQCVPFARDGLRRLASWGPGSTLRIGATDRGREAISLTFAHDAAVGVVLTSIGHRGRRLDGRTTVWDYPARPPAGAPPGLWKAVLRELDDRTKTVEVTPAAAKAVHVWVEKGDHPRTAVFAWTGLSIPDPAADSRFWMELCVRIPEDRPGRAEWHSRMGRIARGGSKAYTLDEVHAPIVYAAQPAADSARARILVPASTTIPLPATNTPMRLWALLGLSVDFEHPARGQSMQFSALYGGDPSIEVPEGDVVRSPYRKILYFATEDHTGHYKRFRHSVVSDPFGVAYFRWCPRYYPVYGPSKRVNFHVSPYPAVICALSARNEAWWFDVTAHYRDFVRRRMGLTPILSRRYRLNPDYPRASIFIATSNFQTTVPAAEQAAIYADYVDVARRYREVLRGADGRRVPTFLEWQKWLRGDPTGAASGGSTEDPIGPGFLPAPFTRADTYQQPTAAALAQIARAHDLGINVSVYTLPLQIQNGPGQWTGFRDVWYLRDVLGEKIPASPAPGSFLVDFGYLPVPFFFGHVVYADMQRAAPGLGGYFLDTVGGLGSFLRYPPKDWKPRKLFRHGYNGGTAYVRGGQRLFDVVRARVAWSKRTRRHPDLPFVFTEAVQEFYAGRFDFAQHGIKPLPHQAQMNPVLDQIAGTVSPLQFRADLPQANEPHPPLWNAVYHEYARAEAVGVMLSSLAVSAADGGGQTPPFPGVSWRRWGDYQRMVAALRFVQGMKATFFPYFADFRGLSLIVEDAAGVHVRDPSRPEQVSLLAFLQRLHHAADRNGEARDILAGGAMERPLELPVGDRLDAWISQSPTPSFEMATLAAPVQGATLHFNEDAFTTDAAKFGSPFPAYPMMHVLHSVWRVGDDDDRLYVVMVNWSDQPARWRATFDPAAYEDFDEEFDVLGLRPQGAGVSTYRLGRGRGRTVLSWGAGGDVALRHYSAAAPGEMPPRSVQIVVLESGH